jgi:hypothetical protein
MELWRSVLALLHNSLYISNSIFEIQIHSHSKFTYINSSPIPSPVSLNGVEITETTAQQLIYGRLHVSPDNYFVSLK